MCFVTMSLKHFKSYCYFYIILVKIKIFDPSLVSDINDLYWVLISPLHSVSVQMNHSLLSCFAEGTSEKLIFYYLVLHIFYSFLNIWPNESRIRTDYPLYKEHLKVIHVPHSIFNYPFSKIFENNWSFYFIS